MSQAPLPILPSLDGEEGHVPVERVEEEYEDEEDSLLIDEDEGSDDEDGEMGDLRLSAASTQPMQETEWVDALVEKMNDSDETQRYSACIALGQLGAFACLLRMSLSDSERDEVRHAAVSTLSILSVLPAVSRQLYPLGDEFERMYSASSSPSHRRAILRILSMSGYTNHLDRMLSPARRQRGLRILCLDGGGTKAIVPITILLEIEKRTGAKVCNMFDMICGTSTGGILTCCFTAMQWSAPELLDFYGKLCKKIFSIHKIKPESATAKSAPPKLKKANKEKDPNAVSFKDIRQRINNFYKTGGQYNTDNYESLLRDLVKELSLAELAERENTPKMFVVSSLMSVNPPCPYLLRNYGYGAEASRYRGSSELKVWEAIRATSAAPSMFSEFVHQGKRLSDGGLVANNPSGVAFHEAKKLWPNREVDFILNLGTGKVPERRTKNGVLSTLATMASVAAETDTVTNLLRDTLGSERYFRVSPEHTAMGVLIDEVREDRIQAMADATNQYIQEHTDEINRIVSRLKE